MPLSAPAALQSASVLQTPCRPLKRSQRIYGDPRMQHCKPCPAAWQSAAEAPDRSPRAAPQPSLFAATARTAAAVAAAALLLSAGPSCATQLSQEGRGPDDYFETAPQRLSSADEKRPVRLSALISGPHGKEVEACAKRCVATCVRGGQGGPGLGPMSIRRETDGVVLKDGFRSAKYCLSECVQICAIELDPEVARAAEQQAARPAR